MDLSLVKQGRLIVAHPDSVPGIESLDPWQRHSIYLETCRSLSAPKSGRNELAEEGYVSLPGLMTKPDTMYVSALINKILKEQGVAEQSPDPSEANVKLTHDGRLSNALTHLLPLLINDEVETQIESMLGSHFRVDSTSFYRSHVIEDSFISFLWHRDVAPMGQVHLLIYLTDGEDRGSTSYLSLENTRRAAKGGYHFLPLDERADTLMEVFKGTDDVPEAFTPAYKRGDAVLFSAPRILHRGVMPKTAFRDALLLVFQPSPVPWRVEYEDVGVGHLVQSSNKNTLHTNPFLSLQPNIVNQVGGLYGLPPDWVLNSCLTENE